MSTLQVWNGALTEEVDSKFGLLAEQIPTFDRIPFEYEGEVNDKFDTIIKEPLDEGDTYMPVATVSKGYKLVQHRDVISVLAQALHAMDIDVEDSESKLTLSSHAERMWLKLNLGDVHTYDPGDGHPVIFQLHALNSVDRTTTFRLEMGWYRIICKNGLFSMIAGGRSTHRHTAGLDVQKMAQYLHEHINLIGAETDRFDKLYATPIEVGEGVIENWIDATVFPRWGSRTAARCYHILKTSYDGKVDIAEANTGMTPHRISVESEGWVPGQKPVENMYDVVNALSWIASRENTISTRLDKMRDVSGLLDELEGAVNDQ